MLKSDYFSAERFIKKDYAFKYSKVQDVKPTLAVALNTDNNFLMQVGVVLTSILEQNKNINFQFHVFTSEITDNHLSNFKKTADKYKCDCYIHLMNMEPFSGFHIKHPRFNRVAYIRLYMAKTMKDYCKYFAYIDADMLCLGDMHAFLNIDLHGKAVAAVPEIESAANWLADNLHLKSRKYLNSASLWIDVEKWEDEKITERCFEQQNVNPHKFHCHDQDVINLVLDGDWMPLPAKFNYLHEDENVEKADVLMYHFWGRTKPWKIVLTKYDKLWRHYLDVSFWPNIHGDYPPHTPENYFVFRDAAKYLRHHGQYFKAIKCYCWYSILKIANLL